MAEPVGRLVGELRNEKPQDGPEVALTSNRNNLHRFGHDGVTVAAVTRNNKLQNKVKRLLLHCKK